MAAVGYTALGILGAGLIVIPVLALRAAPARPPIARPISRARSTSSRRSAGAQPRRIGRVRQVTPPEPFSPTSSERDRVDLAAGRLEAATRDRRCRRRRSPPPAGPRARCSPASGTPPRAPRRAACRGRASSSYSPAGSSGRNTTARSSATGEITDSRWTSSAGPFQYGTSNTRTSPPTIAASWRAPASFVRSVRPMHSRSGRSQNVSPPSTVPGRLDPAERRDPGGRASTPRGRAGSPARLGLPGRSGIAPRSATSSGSKT